MHDNEFKIVIKLEIPSIDKLIEYFMQRDRLKSLDENIKANTEKLADAVKNAQP